MKSFGQSSITAIENIQKPQQQAQTGTAIALPPREHPLTVAEIAKLEHAIEKSCNEIRRQKSISVPKRDADGYIYAWGFDLQHTGTDLVSADGAELDIRLIEAVKRPATPDGVIFHLTRLAAIKRNTKGDYGFQVILEELASELRGKSEWAIVRACKELMRDPNPFFPDFHAILERVNFHQQTANNIGSISPNIAKIESRNG